MLDKKTTNAIDTLEPINSTQLIHKLISQQFTPLMHSMSFHSKVSFTFPPSRLGVHCFAFWQFATTAMKGIKTIVTPACFSFGGVSLSARNWICRSITRLSVRSTPSLRFRKREASRARLPLLLPENLDRSCSSLRKMRLHFRAPSRDSAHVCAKTQWKTRVVSSHRRLLIRGV